MNLKALVLGAALLLAAGILSAQSSGSGQPARSLPSYNILAGRPKQDPAAARVQSSPLVRPGRGVLMDERLGVPRFLWASATEANRRPAGIRPQFARAGSRYEESVAREHLDRFASHYGMISSDVAGAPLASIHDTGKGAIVVKLRQEVGGVEVFRDEVNVVMNRSMDLMAISGHIPPAGGSASAMASSTFALQAPQALALAFNDLTGVPLDSTAFELIGTQGPYESYQIKPALARGASVRMQTPARVKPVYFNLPEGLRAAYYLELDTRDLGTRAAGACGYVLSAADGSLLFRKNLTTQDAFTYRVWADARKVPLPGPHDPAQYLPSITGAPTSTFPPFTAPTLVTIDTADPWLPPGATETNGNNVDAYVDLDGSDGLTGANFRAPVAGGILDYTYDTSLAPGTSVTQRNASITQLFFLTNFLHDWFYDAGFNEASGNAQTSNHGRGGLEGDNLHAEAQDADGMNNADMFTPADGGHPRMQMFLWDGSDAVRLDGSLDGQIVAHEWGHYISSRLVGNGSGLATNQAGALGEGWGDFHALLLSLQDGNVNLDGTFSVGSYAMRGHVPAGNAYYFGLRRYPYSTDQARNPLTFKHISNGVALPADIPVNANASANAEVHNAGEVWATMLWEAYVALVKDTRSGSPQISLLTAQERMKRYLVAAYKATPVDPTFIEARDALLTVAAAGDHPEDAQLFFEAFARRGAGLGAQAPTDRFGATNAGVVESFTTGGALAFQSATLAEAGPQDGTVSAGETGILSVTLKNLGGAELSHTTATITNPDVTFPGGNLITFPASTPFTLVTGSVQFVLQGDATAATTVFGISYTDPDLAAGGPQAASASFRVNRQDVPSSSATDDFSAGTSPWIPSGAATPVWQYVADTPLTHHWQGPDFAGTSDVALVSPLLQVSPTEPLTLTLTHAYSFETSDGIDWDGGVIEVSTDDGGHWTDLSAYGGVGYSGLLSNISGNPLGGRPAFARANAGYPAPEVRVIALGAALAGQQARIRFRIGTDVSVGGAGWALRKVVIGGITNTPFSTVTTTPTALSLAPSLTDLTVSGGRPASFRMAVHAAGNLAGPVTFTHTGLPPGVRCDFSPVSIAPGSLPAEVTVTITPVAAGSRVASMPRSGPANGAWGLMALVSGLVVLPASRRRGRRKLGMAIAVLGSLLFLTMSCGGGGGGGGDGGSSAAPGPVVSTLTITAISEGAIQGSVTIGLKVLP